MPDLTQQSTFIEVAPGGTLVPAESLPQLLTGNLDAPLDADYGLTAAEAAEWLHRRFGARGRTRLPSAEPESHPIEPKWVHGKGQISEPDPKLCGSDLKQRVCDYHGYEFLDQLAKQAA